MFKRSTLPRWFGAAFAAAIGVALAVGAPDAGAPTSSCSPKVLASTTAAAGERNLATVGYVPSTDSVRVRNADLRPMGGAALVECKGVPTVSAMLDDKDDVLRLNGKGPGMQGAKPLPGDIDLSASGGPDRDDLRGHAGADDLSGDGGRDVLIGGRGPDRLIGGPGLDIYDAGRGGDYVDGRDGIREDLRCGPGFDTYDANRNDVLHSCEAEAA